MITLLKVIISIVFLILIATILALPLMLLWNWLMPLIFGLTKITFWQALGVSVLCRILFSTISTNKN